MCNPNLLINTDFTNPVNQGGQSEYTGYGYCIDMWQSQQDTVIVTLTDKGIIVKGGAIANKIEDSIRLLTGELLTLSVKFYDGVIYKGSGIATVGTHVYDHFIKINAGDRGNFYMQYDGTSYRAVIEGYEDNMYPVAAIKLELGTVSTLKNEIVNYDEQLRKCQRYYQKGSACVAVYSKANYANDGAFTSYVNLGNMRIQPTVTLSKIWVPGYYDVTLIDQSKFVAQPYITQDSAGFYVAVLKQDIFDNILGRCLALDYEANAEL